MPSDVSYIINIPYIHPMTIHSVSDNNIRENTAQYQSRICST